MGGMWVVHEGQGGVEGTLHGVRHLEAHSLHRRVTTFLLCVQVCRFWHVGCWLRVCEAGWKGALHGGQQS